MDPVVDQSNTDTLKLLATLALVVLGMARPPFVSDRLWRFLCWAAAFEIFLWVVVPEREMHVFLGVAAPGLLALGFFAEAQAEKSPPWTKVHPVAVLPVSPQIKRGSADVLREQRDIELGQVRRVIVALQEAIDRFNLYKSLPPRAGIVLASA